MEAWGECVFRKPMLKKAASMDGPRDLRHGERLTVENKKRDSIAHLRADDEYLPRKRWDVVVASSGTMYNP